MPLAQRRSLNWRKFAACRVRDGEQAWSEDVRTTGNLVAASFRHDCSRAYDPQLHTHNVTANATWDTERAVGCSE